jgi:hypothetical protein
MRIALKSAVALGAALAAAPAFPAERCRVTDPTGTPLNVRAQNANIIGTIKKHHWHDQERSDRHHQALRRRCPREALGLRRNAGRRSDRMGLSRVHQLLLRHYRDQDACSARQ